MGNKPTGEAVAARATRALPEGIAYARMDCKEFIEYCVRQCGGALDTSGTNDMARNHCAWLGTLGNARAEGKLVKGAMLLIHEETEADLPDRYRGDGLGDFSHVGVYVGENALEDVDKQGKRRKCNVMHSSASMGRVAGSTLKNGWTHVMLLNEMDYGMETGGLSLGEEVGEAGGEVAEGLTAGSAAGGAYYAVVYTEDGNPVKLRKTASTQETEYWKVGHRAKVRVERKKGDWALVTAICTDGYERRAYMLDKYLHG